MRSGNYSIRLRGRSFQWRLAETLQTLSSHSKVCEVLHISKFANMARKCSKPASATIRFDQDLHFNGEHELRVASLFTEFGEHISHDLGFGFAFVPGCPTWFSYPSVHSLALESFLWNTYSLANLVPNLTYLALFNVHVWDRQGSERPRVQNSISICLFHCTCSFHILP